MYYRTNIQSGSNLPIIDKVGAAAAAYSIGDDLNSAYTGNVIAVSRTGDSAIQSFGFTTGLDGVRYVDFEAVRLWVVAGGGTQNGQIQTIFDQSGNGNNMIQNTVSRRPFIVVSGVLVTNDGVVCARFNSGVVMFMTATSVASPTTGAFLLAIAKPESSDTNIRALVSDSIANNRAFILAQTNPTRMGLYASELGVTNSNFIAPVAGLNYYGGQINGESSKFYVGNDYASGTLPSTIFASSANLQIGTFDSTPISTKNFVGLFRTYVQWNNSMVGKESDIRNWAKKRLTTIPLPTPSTINVFLVGGQSNTNGEVSTATGGTPAYLTDNLVDGVKVFNGTSIIDYSLTAASAGQSGNGRNWSVTATGNNWSFVHVALKKISDSIGNVVACQVTQGGSILNEQASSDPLFGSWGTDFGSIPGGTPSLLSALETRFNTMKEYCRLFNITINLRGFIWHQGEADRFNPADVNYETNFNDLVDYVRNFTSSPSLPFFYGTVPSTSSSYNATVRAAHLAVAAAKSDMYCRDNNGYTFIDGLHFDAASCITFGEWVEIQYTTNY